MSEFSTEKVLGTFHTRSKSKAIVFVSRNGIELSPQETNGIVVRLPRSLLERAVKLMQESDK